MFNNKNSNRYEKHKCTVDTFFVYYISNKQIKPNLHIKVGGYYMKKKTPRLIYKIYMNSL